MIDWALNAEHLPDIDRFGNYVLDMSSPPAPLPFTLPQRRQTSGRLPAMVDV